MSRSRKKKLPQMTRHSSGQARVRVGGRTYYLGLWGSAEAALAYAEFLREWERSGYRAPEKATTPSARDRRIQDIMEGYGIPQSAAQKVEALARTMQLAEGEALALARIRHEDLFEPTGPAITLKQAFADYEDHLDATGRYLKDGRATAQRGIVKRALAEWSDRDGETAISKVNESLLLRHRDRLELKAVLTRSGINRKIGIICRALRWCWQRGVLPRDSWLGISAIEPLKRGELPADRDRKIPKRAATPEEVEAVAKNAGTVVGAMMRLQVLVGARPGEVCKLRHRDIDRTPVRVGDVECWVWRVASSKVEHHGRKIVYAIPPKAQAILEQFTGLPYSYVFSPEQAERERLQEQRKRADDRYGDAARPNARRDAARRENPQLVLGECYSTNTYRQAIERAIRRTKGAAKFTPHEIRHGFATRAAQQFGLLQAQAALGHASSSTTARYTHADYTAGFAVAVGLSTGHAADAASKGAESAKAG